MLAFFWGVEGVVDVLGELGAESFDCGDVRYGCLSQLLHTPEVFDQFGASSCAESFDVVEFAALHSGGSLLPVEGDGESVCFVADVMDQKERLGVSGEDEGVLLPRDPDFF